MASFSGPKLSNRIADDVPDIQAVLSSLAKLTPDSGNTDYPIGTKRVAETTNGYEFQQYNGTGWVTLEKWNIDAQKVDGYSASTGTTANTIPVRNADKKLPGDITGNAATATSAQSLSEINPISKGGTGAGNVDAARANLGVAPISHASSTTTYGAGNSTQYGHLRSSDTPDTRKTAATGDAFSPAGAAALETSLTERVDGVVGDVQSLDTALRALIAEEVAKCLKLSGGTMTGNINFSQDGDSVLWKTKSAARFILRGGGSNFEDGASLYLHGKDHAGSPGELLLYAHNGTANAWAKLTPAGKMFVKSDEVLTSAGGSVAKLTSTAEYAINRSVDNSRMIIYGGINSTAGNLILYGENHASFPSESRLVAGSNNFRVLPAGGAMLGGSKVLTEASGTASVSAALAESAIVTGSTAGKTFTLPTVGTWAYTYHRYTYGDNAGGSGIAAGGTTITAAETHITYFAIRVA